MTTEQAKELLDLYVHKFPQIADVWKRMINELEDVDGDQKSVWDDEPGFVPPEISGGHMVITSVTGEKMPKSLMEN